MSACGKFVGATALSLAFTFAANAQAPQTEKNVSMNMALMIIDGTLEQCSKVGYKVSVVLVDKGGNVAASVRGDGTNPHTMEFARLKAYTARTVGRTSYFKLSATLAIPAFAQASSFSLPGAPDTPTPLIGTPPPIATTFGTCFNHAFSGFSIPFSTSSDASRLFSSTRSEAAPTVLTTIPALSASSDTDPFKALSPASLGQPKPPTIPPRWAMLL